MKNILIGCMAFAAWTFAAAEFDVEQPTVNLKKEWDAGTLTGKNYTDGTIGGKDYPNVWSYWFIKSGATPETFEMAPLNAIPKESKTAQIWKNYTILAAEFDGEKLRLPALMKSDFFIYDTKNSIGGAFAFTNPFHEKVKVIIEGNFNHMEDMEVFIYAKTKDGKITMLGDNKNKDCIHQVSNTWPDGTTIVRNYMKLQMKYELEAGDSIFFTVRDPEGAEGKYTSKKKNLFHVNDNWGKTWNPIFIIEKN